MEITNWLDTEIKRHRKWRNIWSVTYSVTAALTIIAGALTTASAGLFENSVANIQYTTGLAAITTILASLEKVLRLKDKWDLHRNIQISLEIIHLRLASEIIDVKEAVNQIDQAAQGYSSNLAELNSAAHGHK